MKTKYAECTRPLIQLGGSRGQTWAETIDVWTVFTRGVCFAVPKGFRTDGASIPRLLWRVCGHPMEVPRVYAATAHDYLYSNGAPGVSRKEADRCYYDLLRHFGVSFIRAKIEYWALRACGWSHWRALP